MPVNDDAQSLCLTIVTQSDTMVLSLTDLHQVSRLAAIAQAGVLLGDLELALDSTLGRADIDAAAPEWCEFGRRLASTLLPPAIAAVLHDSAPRGLILQIEPALAWVPWELAFDGEKFLGEKMSVYRQIVASRVVPPPACATAARRGALKVLVLTSYRPPFADGDVALALIARLRTIDAVAVTVAQIPELRRDDLAALAAESDVVHVVGQVGARAATWQDDEPFDVGAISSLASAPPLLVVQEDAAAIAGSDKRRPARSGGALAVVCSENSAALICAPPIVDNDALEFLTATYAGIAKGHALADAVRDARSAVHGCAGITRLAALRPELYGEGAAVLFPAERRPCAEDNLRQVTVMSIDLVESTRLLGELGAERYSDLLVAYHRRGAAILKSSGGLPDDPQGDDGSMCYFGLPVAREDAAAKALQAGFELIDAVQALGLAVRIGVCTGEVVVRDGQPVGPAVHFAARLQSIAAPGTMVVGESTRRIVRTAFRFHPLEHVGTLKGIDRPERCFRALAGAPLPSLHDLSAPMTPFVGRDAELQSLEEHWAAARAGSLRLVRVVGEAGIGKSRLVREFKNTLTSRGVDVFECRCAPDHVNSAFHPLIDSLRALLRVSSSEGPATTLQRLRSLVARMDLDDSALPLLADLLGVAMPAQHQALQLAGERRRRLTVDLLVVLAVRLMKGTAAAFIIEDAQWVDPSTAEFLNRFARAGRRLPLMMIATARPDTHGWWHPRSPVHETELRGLSAAMSRALVLGTCRDQRLPSEVVHLIAARADGVPLFLEESTRMAVETGGARIDASGSPPVPMTLLDLLTARLDGLGVAKQVAQVGGTIGREFPLALLQAVLAHPESPFATADLAAHLGALQRSGMLIARRVGEETSFAFKHALLRDAAYRSLLARERSRLHQVIAQVIGAQFRDLGERQPELLAFHYTQAGISAEALRLWEVAARQAASRSANAEAIGHIENGLAVLRRAPSDAGTYGLELRLQLLLATRLIATHGYGADSVERAYARAMALAQTLGDGTSLMRVLLGLEGYYFMRADFARAKEYALKAASEDSHRNDTIRRIQIQWALANIVMHQGEMEAAVRQMDQCRAEYDRLERRPDAVQDPGVMCLCYSAWSLWQLGFPDQALHRTTAVVQLAERLKHPFSLGEAYGFHAAVLHFRGENRAALDSAERAIAICEEGGFAVWLAHARIMRGRILAELGDGEDGIEEMRHGYELWAATGAVVTTPFYLAMRAEALARAERSDEARALLDQALALVERTGERYYEPEIRRLVGQITLQSAQRAGIDRLAEGELWLRQALACAQTLKMASLTLRCATALADLLTARGLPRKAAALLRPAYDAITEGRGTRDLVNAQVRLAALDTETSS